MLKTAPAAYRTLQVFPTESGFGAEIVGVDLSRPLLPEALAEIRDAWARHAVVSFPDQPLSLEELEAFTRGDATYLLESWHASTRPASVDLDDGTVWRTLQIVDVVAGGPEDATGIVEFRASFRGPDGAGVLHERSNFVREGGRWFYLDGVAGQV